MARGVQLLLGPAPAPRESPQPRLGVGQGMAWGGICPPSQVPGGLWGAEVLKCAAGGRWGEEEEEGELSEMPGIHLPLPLPSPF